MIDVLINQNGQLHLAHDAEDLPRVTSLTMSRETGKLTAVTDDGAIREIGALTDSNLKIVGTHDKCMVYPMRGYEITDAYEAGLEHA